VSHAAVIVVTAASHWDTLNAANDGNSALAQ
jgi:hypothetical protein